VAAPRPEVAHNPAASSLSQASQMARIIWRGTGKGKSVRVESGRFLKNKSIKVAVSGLPKVSPWKYGGPYTKAGYPCCAWPVVGQPKSCGICGVIPKVYETLQHQL